MLAPQIFSSLQTNPELTRLYTMFTISSFQIRERLYGLVAPATDGIVTADQVIESVAITKPVRSVITTFTASNTKYSRGSNWWGVSRVLYCDFLKNLSVCVPV